MVPRGQGCGEGRGQVEGGQATAGQFNHNSGEQMCSPSQAAPATAWPRRGAGAGPSSCSCVQWAGPSPSRPRSDQSSLVTPARKGAGGGCAGAAGALKGAHGRRRRVCPTAHQLALAPQALPQPVHAWVGRSRAAQAHTAGQSGSAAAQRRTVGIAAKHQNALLQRKQRGAAAGARLGAGDLDLRPGTPVARQKWQKRMRGAKGCVGLHGREERSSWHSRQHAGWGARHSGSARHFPSRLRWSPAGLTFPGQTASSRPGGG